VIRKYRVKVAEFVMYQKPQVQEIWSEVLAYTAEDAIVTAALRFGCYERQGPASTDWKRVVDVEPVP